MDGKDMTEGAKPPRRARRLAAIRLVVSGSLAGGILAGSQVANLERVHVCWLVGPERWR